ncbi:MAG: DNA (cytosine-5-)-methyltransferase [Flavobacteriales bacterium]
MEPIKVVELFAGVGGFRIGLERASERFQVVWSNQWEPGVKRQAASDVYVARFGAEHHSNTDIAQVPAKDVPKHDLLVGGFPCQDYSVARTLKQSEGLGGKKGVLWWEIHRILKHRNPALVLLENVDRLLKSPAQQRGRDFAVMLASLSDLGYAVEWRVINAAEHGMPQRRRRVFILAYHRSSALGAVVRRVKDASAYLCEQGTLAEAFSARPDGPLQEFRLEGDLATITRTFNHGAKRSRSPFANAGLMIDRKVATLPLKAAYDGPFMTLGELLLPNDQVPKEYFVPKAQERAWRYLKGGKSEVRTSSDKAFNYTYSEGPMAFPDPLDKPARTIVTGEGGSSPSRFKHVVRVDGKLRRLTPVELERINMFPDGHTAGANDTKRAFFMGNALVTGIVERIGRELVCRLEDTDRDVTQR